ncbi:MAG: GlsB/YeaQ/YmgE family stress response membrane protein [Chloroflexota bacterium]
MICNWIGWLVLGAIAGWGASKVMGTSGQQGLVMDIVVGIVGAFVGGFVISLIPGLSVQATGLNIPSLIVAFVGAVIVLFVFKRLRKA